MSKPTGGFHVHFVRQLRRTPWWAASLTFHVVLLLFLYQITFADLAPAASRPVTWRPGVEFGAVLDEDAAPVSPKEQPLEEPAAIGAPSLRDTEVSDHNETDNDLPFEESLGALGVGSVGVFDGPSTNASIGIGGGAGGAFGGRGGRRHLQARGGGRATGRPALLVIEAAETDGAPPVFRGREITGGTLLAYDERDRDLGAIPLTHSDLRAEITGFLNSATLTQRFANDLDVKVEAIYVFPLPRTAAVHDFEMVVGDRVIRGMIRERAEARRIYEEAKRQGRVASLVTQERPNIFTQSVANLEPGKVIDVTIRYFHPLRMKDGWLELVFPTVVGPRYIPGSARSGPSVAGGWSPDTDQVPDASRITPHVAPPGRRAGHDVAIAVSIDAGVPIAAVECRTHEIAVERPAPERAEVTLRDGATLPNQDFVLRYRVTGGEPQAALLAHRGRQGGFFTLVLSPPSGQAADLVPREMVFVLDCSGSMGGAPIEKAKAVVRKFLRGLRPFDTFRVIRFSGTADELAAAPLPVTPENVDRALAFVDAISGGGGTEMSAGIRAALSPVPDPERVRYVCFLTDGYIGNEQAILALVRSHRQGARLFSFGVGSSVNRYLLDMLAEEGRGVAQYVLEETPPEAAAAEFFRRVAAPCLVDLEVDFGGIPVQDVYPEEVPDVHPGVPLMLTGRYDGGGRTRLTLTGRRGTRPFRQEIEVEFPEWEERHEVLGPVWARAKIQDLLHKDHLPLTSKLETEVTRLALDFRLLSPFTAFVAVDTSRVTAGDGGIVVHVPVMLPDGVEYSGVFGDQGEYFELSALGLQMALADLGLRVNRVRPGSPADAAGLRVGDAIFTLNSTYVRNGREAEAAIRQAKDQLEVGVLRAGGHVRIVFERAD